MIKLVILAAAAASAVAAAKVSRDSSTKNFFKKMTAKPKPMNAKSVCGDAQDCDADYMFV